jgi:integral membrane protein (TIGR01906 family)
MNPVENALPRGMVWIITILVPFLLVMTAVRILMTGAFLQYEYHTPNFPADPYGFTLTERLRWANPSVEYLVNNAGISYLKDLKFDNGQSIYNERELSHMSDVKNLVQTTLRLWRIGLVLMVIFALVSLWRGWAGELQTGMARGGWLTVGLIVAMLVGVATSFDWLFTQFHHLFFTGGTWLFYYSDTLIRLFPMRFWQDAFILVGAFCIICGLLLGILLRTRRSVPR